MPRRLPLGHRLEASGSLSRTPPCVWPEPLTPPVSLSGPPDPLPTSPCVPLPAPPSAPPRPTGQEAPFCQPLVTSPQRLSPQCALSGHRHPAGPLTCGPRPAAPQSLDPGAQQSTWGRQLPQGRDRGRLRSLARGTGRGAGRARLPRGDSWEKGLPSSLGGLPVWLREVTPCQPQQTVMSLSEVAGHGAGTCPARLCCSLSGPLGDSGHLGSGEAALEAGVWLG